ncbi:sigma 54-dependent Fis family transcriptional regulator [Archangium violaceum]|nr:sigma 54-dependent Fis family transcriptional regulator [Archangium violaceum]
MSRASRVRLDSTSGALQLRRYRLSVVSGPDAGHTMLLEDSLVLGSRPRTGMRLSDPAVSREHVELQLREEGVWVRDLGSTNGTYLSGARIREVLVEREATLTVGKSVLRLVLEQADVGPALALPVQFGGAIGQSVRMRQLFGFLERVAEVDSTVLLLGETGTGKEVLAEAIHRASPRRDRPFVVIDCGAVAPSLVESELFGHVRGAFSGAASDRDGAFLEADGGTVFLDEVGELPLELQPKLLRVLETGSVKRLGENRTRKVDIRVVAATHRELTGQVAAGRFRQDLYFRLAVVLARVPALRERAEDIPLLVHHFISRLGRPDFELSPALMEQLTAHAWPGNVRELRNVVERALVGPEPDLTPEAAASPAPVPLEPGLVQLPFKEAKERLVETFTRDYLVSLLERCQGNISEAARTAQLGRNHVHRLVKRYGLKGQE